jgi:hypothetical protein
MDQGFWLFFIFQVLALGAMADRMNLVGLRKSALVAGLAASTGAPSSPCSSTTAASAAISPA